MAVVLVKPVDNFRLTRPTQEVPNPSICFVYTRTLQWLDLISYLWDNIHNGKRRLPCGQNITHHQRVSTTTTSHT